MSLWRGGLWNSLQSVNGVGPWRGSLWRSEKDSTALAIKKLLFSEGQQGVFYVPQPTVFGKQVLFQDSAGTTPVTTDGQPVGLMLDLSKGLVKGPELVTNGTFDTDTSGWSALSGATLSATSSVLTVSVPPGDDVGVASQEIAVTPGKTYEFSCEVISVSPSYILGISSEFANGGRDLYDVTGSSPTTRAVKFTATTASAFVQLLCFGDGSDAAFDNVTLRELPGDHATQSTAAAKPIYRTDGALHWLEFDGVDDYLVSASVDLSSISDVSVFAAANKVSDANRATILNHKDDGFNAFTLEAPGSSAPASTGYELSAAGDSLLGKARFSEPAPDKSVVSGTISLSSPFIVIRRNGIERASDTGSLGGGSFTNSPLTIGATEVGGKTRFFNGDVYGIVLVGEGVDMPPPEKYLATLAGVTL